MAVLTCIPGYSWSASERLTIAKLRATGQPIVSPSTDVFALFSTLKNAFINGGLQLWERGTTVAPAAATATWLADRWFVNTISANLTYERDTTVPSGASSAYSAKLSQLGGAGATSASLLQRIEAAEVPAIWRTTRTVSAYIYNGTGASFIPNLFYREAGATDNYGTVGGDNRTALQACADAQWTQVSATVDASTLTKGFEIGIEFPASVIAAGSFVRVAQLQAELGSTVTNFDLRPTTLERELCARFYQTFTSQLIGVAATATTLDTRGAVALRAPIRYPIASGGGVPLNNITFSASTGAAGTFGFSFEAPLALEIFNLGAAWTIGDEISMTGYLDAEIR